MNKINLAEISIEKSRSPKGRYRRLSQHISKALTGVNGLLKSGLKQPFDVELVRLPAGAANWPYHSHTAQWELYLILSGRGRVRTPAGHVEVHEGDCLVHPPGEPHQIRNTGASRPIAVMKYFMPQSKARRFRARRIAAISTP